MRAERSGDLLAGWRWLVIRHADVLVTLQQHGILCRIQISSRTRCRKLAQIAQSNAAVESAHQLIQVRRSGSTMETNEKYIAYLLGPSLTDFVYKSLSMKKIMETYRNGEGIRKNTKRLVNKSGGQQVFGPQRTGGMSGCTPSQGPGFRRVTDCGVKIEQWDYTRNDPWNDNMMQQYEFSSYLKEMGAQAYRLAKHFAVPYTKGHYAGRQGSSSPCALTLLTSDWFFSSMHKDGDVHSSGRKSMNLLMLDKLSEFVGKAKLGGTAKMLTDSLLPAQKVAAETTLTTCTYLIDESSDWEIFSYFILPSSGIAIELSHKCALVWHAGKISHGTAVNVAKNKKTGMVIYLGIGPNKNCSVPGSVRAWGEGKTGK